MKCKQKRKNTVVAGTGAPWLTLGKMADISFSPRAYGKMILHCAKYPHCAVNGVLLAENSKSKALKNDGSLHFVDAIPLFHICLHLSPMYEVALTQVKLHCRSS